MTHTPTLPNGFSRDFSAVPVDNDFLVYAMMNGEPSAIIAWYMDGERFFSDYGFIGNRSSDIRPLCWCPIPTPGDAVLKELAEEGK